MTMYGRDNECLYSIENVSLIPQRFKIVDSDGSITFVERDLTFGGSSINVKSEEIGDFTVKGNVWSNKFEFLNNNEEMALLSVKVWTAKDYGFVIKSIYSSSLLLCIACIIAYLKESGQL